MTQLSHPYREIKPHFSLPSLVAIVAGIVSLFVHGGAALALAIVALIAGIIGVLISLSPTVRGGIISVLAIILGVIGFLIGLIRLIV
jgi:hypothetical protein